MTFSQCIFRNCALEELGWSLCAFLVVLMRMHTSEVSLKVETTDRATLAGQFLVPVGEILP